MSDFGTAPGFNENMKGIAVVIPECPECGLEVTIEECRGISENITAFFVNQCDCGWHDPAEYESYHDALQSLVKGGK